MLEMANATANATLSDWLAGKDTDPDLNAIVHLFAEAGSEIAATLRGAALRGDDQSAGVTNVQGEEQKKLDIISHDIVVEKLNTSPQVAALVSEEVPDLIVQERADPAAAYIVCFDPLDGSSNLAVNGGVGSIFSVLGRKNLSAAVDDRMVFDSAIDQRAAGYVLYGPATLLVLTVGQTVASFALDEMSGKFLLVRDGLRVPARAEEFSINMAYQRFFPEPVAAYIADCLAGETGPRGKNFNMRWSAAMVADVHRLFLGGGIFIYPALDRPGGANGKLRFLYEANPMALLVEIAGGRAIANGEPLRAVVPESLHQRVPVALGSRDEVARLAAHYAD